MVGTRVGYAGGTTPSPAYHSLGDHSETVEIDYDPARLSYEDLLAVFWREHDPRHSPSRQYRSAILYRTEEERVAAEASRASAKSLLGPVATSIEPLDRFWPAEEYHQRYHWKQWVRTLPPERQASAPGPSAREFCAWLNMDRFWGAVSVGGRER